MTVVRLPIPRNAPDNDPAAPNHVWAVGPDKAVVRLFANPTTLQQMRQDRWNEPIAQYCGLVHGKLFTDAGTPGLVSAAALFKGLRRPLIALDHDSGIHAYVLNSTRSFRFEKDTQDLVRIPAPARSVFCVYVDFSQSAIQKARATRAQDIGDIAGVIHFWEWVIASADQPNLPADFEARYDGKVWGP